MRLLNLWTCKQLFKRLDDYIDRELNAKELKGIERHLRMCRHCARRFQFEASVLRDLKDKLRRIQAPKGMVQRVHEALLQEEPPGRSE